MKKLCILIMSLICTAVLAQNKQDKSIPVKLSMPDEASISEDVRDLRVDLESLGLNSFKYYLTNFDRNY